ncbi:MAG: hypothetical protein AAGM22_31015 [Acidobacteriota bacterium]
MDLITVGLGLAAILYAGYTFYVRSQNPEAFGKLTAMQDRWGEKAGTALHLVAYSIVPFIFGGVLVVGGLNGYALF